MAKNNQNDSNNPNNNVFDSAKTNKKIDNNLDVKNNKYNNDKSEVNAENVVKIEAIPDKSLNKDSTIEPKMDIKIDTKKPNQDSLPKDTLKDISKENMALTDKNNQAKPLDNMNKIPDKNSNKPINSVNNKPTEIDMAADKVKTNDSNNQGNKVKDNTSSNSPQKSKGGNGVASLALLVGVIGAGVAGYNYTELQKVKMPATNGADIKTAIASFKTEFSEEINTKLAAAKADYKPANVDTSKFATSEAITSLNKQINDVDSQIKQLMTQVDAMKTDETNKSADNSTSNQTNAATNAMSSDESAALKSQLQDLQKNYSKLEQQLATVANKSQSGSALDTDKIKQELTASLKQDLNQAIVLQSVYQTITQANYQLTNLHDIKVSETLLDSAAAKLGDSYPNIKAAIAKQTAQLKSYDSADNTELLKNVADIKANITNLTAKTSESQPSNTAEQAAKPASFTDKALNIIKGSVKFTPANGELDVSAETATIQKRLMQSDVNILQYAVLTANQDLLNDTVKSLTKALNNTFASNPAFNQIKTSLAALQKANLKIDNSGLLDLIKTVEQQLTAETSAK